MLVGRIIGKTTPERFYFEVTEVIKKMDFVAVRDTERHWVLGRIDSIFQEKDKTIAKVSVIGYKDSRGVVTPPRMPFKPGSLVYKADDLLIKRVLGLKSSGLYIGILQNSENLKIYLDPKKIITKHMAILAKTGAGKSYLVAVLLEEFIENKIPAVVIDPHGEYTTLKVPNDNPEELKYVERFEIEPQGYEKEVEVYCLEKNLIEGAKKLRFPGRLTSSEIFEMLPFRLSGAQMNIIYNAARNLDALDYTLDDLIKEVEFVKSKTKWSVISVLESLKSTGLFVEDKYTDLKELVKPGKITIINLKGIEPDIQTLVVYKLAHDLFELRKISKIPPFVFVVEEAHNFCPERGFGEVVSSKILRTIASEGRKFGMGLVVVSQRAARIDKNVLSQCNTQAFLRINNPNDLKSITDSVEGVTPELVGEIKTLPVGTALITGIIDQPLIVDIRIRRSRHAGVALPSEKKEKKKSEKEGKERFFLLKVMEEDIKSLIKKPIEAFKLVYHPVWRIKMVFVERGKPKEDFLLVDGIKGEVVYREKDSLVMTENLLKAASLPPIPRAIVFYLTTYGDSTLTKISTTLNLSVGEAKKELEKLEKVGLVETDGFVYKSRVKADFKKIMENQIKDEIASGKIKGEKIDFMVSKDKAKNVLNIFQPDGFEIEKCYYPVWVVDLENGDRIVLDGLTGKESKFFKDLVKM
ncbi:MAG: ATP-binding protein [Candidatus Aenigmarchaeota archaeon]|nr:ATP-binding protein [Candidatus Aenigmarchaeota archaeon]